MNSQISSPFSTGQGGAHFEAHVQASFVTLMLTRGCAPCFPGWLIKEIQFQGKIAGYNTDDVIIFVEQDRTQERRKLIAQIKKTMQITEKNNDLQKVIQGMWNDFNNPEVFTKGKDVIALITGPLSETDGYTVPWILDQARCTKDADEFYRHVQQSGFSSKYKKEKLNAICHHIHHANNNEVAEEKIYEFLRHFYLLGYDLGVENGVVLSLLHSHISIFSQNPRDPWSRIVDMVQTWNQNAGTITIENIPEDLIREFQQPIIRTVPEEFKPPQKEEDGINLPQYPHLDDLVLANLIGSWDESNIKDISVLNILIKQDYDRWIKKIQKNLLHDNPLFSYKDGVWKVKDRGNTWEILGPYVFERYLDALKKLSVQIFTDRDLYFSTPAKRNEDIIYDREIPRISSDLRQGLANSLALLGSRPEALTYCSMNKVQHTVGMTIYEIFTNADAVLWGSLNEVLPLLAEAYPDNFLTAVEEALQLDPCPFDELFAKEGQGITGQNYMTGLLWALEGLAWDEENLVRVCVILGKLAARDPGGMWANRPENSLTTILLPWFPQTRAPIQKRAIAIEIISKEEPEVAWRLIISLLPGQTESTHGSHKPVWRDFIVKTKMKKVTKEEYDKQISLYYELAVDIAEYDIKKLQDLSLRLGSLPPLLFEKLLLKLSSEKIISLPERERLPVWETLKKLALQHRKYPSARWSLDEESVLLIDKAADKLTPSEPSNLYRRLFVSRFVEELYAEKDNIQEQAEALQKKREQAIKEILESGGIEQIIEFVKMVEEPRNAGWASGRIADMEMDQFFLPGYLQSEDNKISLFMHEYIISRHHAQDWTWADNMDRSGWAVEQTAQFLAFLPFTNETWNRVEKWLGDREADYWKKTDAFPYRFKSDWAPAVDKLIKYGRPRAAVFCLKRMLDEKQKIDTEQCIKALLEGSISSKEIVLDSYELEVTELIKMLQGLPDIDFRKIARVEWACLGAIRNIKGVSPKCLERYIADNPVFFCELICLVYRPRNGKPSTDKKHKKNEFMAESAFRILWDWKTPPGRRGDGSFDGEHLKQWLQTVKKICVKEKRLEVALQHVGQVLIYCPKDADGLWINHSAAKILNEEKAKDIRTGFSMGLHNSRGASWVDPTGKPEKEFAAKYRQQAGDVENAGYSRLATTLRNVAEDYERQARRIIYESDEDEDDGEDEGE